MQPMGGPHMNHRRDLYEGYFPGVDCNCGAYGQCECGCFADWTPKVEKLVKAWRDMPASEMRLRCGEMTAQEIHTVRAVLNQIMPSNAEPTRPALPDGGQTPPQT